ncbi:hypothetical protein J4410_00595 [Candidatus Woesearchaeota archaeon]|nr:hypothetical protein [Candidatus Woesearchaeota archaeon]
MVEHTIREAFVVGIIALVLISSVVFLDNENTFTGAVVSSLQENKAFTSPIINSRVAPKQYPIHLRPVRIPASPIKWRESCEGCLWGNTMVVHISDSASVLGYKDKVGGIGYFRKNDLIFEKKPSFFVEENTCVPLGSSLFITSYKGKSSPGSLRCVEKGVKGWQFYP